MTLEYAIANEENLANVSSWGSGNVEQERYHRQIANWLRELQGYKADRVCCEFCKYQDRLEHERPCSLCKHNFVDKFEREVKADEKDKSTIDDAGDSE